MTTTMLTFHADFIDLDYSSQLQKLYLFNCGLLLTLIVPIVKIVSPLMYQSLPQPLKSVIKEFYGGLSWYLLVFVCHVIRWLILPMLPIVTPFVVALVTLLKLTCLDHYLFQYLCFGACVLHSLVPLGILCHYFVYSCTSRECSCIS